MKKIRLYSFLTICLVFIVISCINKTFENDVFFTIPTGEYIIENGIDDTESFTWHDNLKFTKLRWGFDICIAKLYEIGGFNALYVFTVFISILIALVLFTTLIKRSNNYIISFIVATFSILCISGYLTCRAQIISYLLFVLEMFFIEKMIETENKKYIVYLAIICELILCFHSSVWLMFFVLFVPYIIEWIINLLKIDKFVNKTEKVTIRKFDNNKAKMLLITMLISMLLGFCTPLGLSPYTYSIKTMLGFSSKIIMELQKVNIEETFSIGFLCFIIIAVLGLTKTKIKCSDLIYIVIFLILSKLAERNMYIAILVLAYPIANLLNTLIDTYKMTDKMDNVENYFNDKILPKIIILEICIFIIFINLKKTAKQQYIDKSLYPVDASEYIINNIDYKNARFYNNFNNGSYLEFKGIPSFVDSRSEIYCREFNNVTILEDMANFELFYTMSVDEIVNKYQITHLLIERRKKIFRVSK
ncbi:MAG: hypothetical protein IJ890_08215 [Clostridia bacterium]|nr:hypothetical protein [Clostridia bacterium]